MVSVQSNVEKILQGMGLLPNRLDRAAAADPQNVWQSIFTVTGGNIAVTGLIGVRTIIQAGGASTMQFQHTVATTVLDAGTRSIAVDNPGALYILTGDPTDPIASAGAGVAAGAPVFAGRVVATSLRHGSPILFYCGPGSIQVKMTAAAGTGSTRYILFYISLDDVVSVAAA